MSVIIRIECLPENDDRVTPLDILAERFNYRGLEIVDLVPRDENGVKKGPLRMETATTGLEDGGAVRTYAEHLLDGKSCIFDPDDRRELAQPVVAYCAAQPLSKAEDIIMVARMRISLAEHLTQDAKNVIDDAIYHAAQPTNATATAVDVHAAKDSLFRIACQEIINAAPSSDVAKRAFLNSCLIGPARGPMVEAAYVAHGVSIAARNIL